MWATAIILSLAISYGVTAAVVQTNEESSPRCASELESACLKFDLVKNLDKVMHQRNFNLFSGVQLEQIPGTERLTAGRAMSENELESSLPQETDKRDEKLDSFLEDRVSKLIASRALRISLDMLLPGSSLRIARSSEENSSFNVALDIPEGSRSLGDARTRGGLRRFLPFLLLFKSSAGILGFLFLFSIAVLAGKALLVGKLALLLSSIIGLKKLFHSEPYVPVVSYAQSGGYSGYSGYSRSLDEQAKQGAYRGQEN